MRARHRLSKLLLRRGIVWEERAWTQAHELWLSRQRFPERPLQIAYEEALAAMFSVRERRDALDAAIAVEAATEPWAEVVDRLSCLRGVSTLTAFALTVKIGDWQRSSGRSLGAFLGLAPSESSSGSTRRQGAITNVGGFVLSHELAPPVGGFWTRRELILLAQRSGIYARLQVRREAASRPYVHESFDADAPNGVDDVGIDQGVAAKDAALVSEHVVDSGNDIGEVIDVTYSFEEMVDHACHH